MKLNCVYFDDEMSLIQEVRQTKDQLSNHGVELDNMEYGFVLRGKNLVNIPKNWDYIMEYGSCKDVKWSEFIFNGTLWLIGISYKD
jgi:hypothetical protein